jgi:methyltransferase (TIGR00027 family)
MEEGRPSQTALIVAALRAYHYQSAAEPRILDDSLAGLLAGMAAPAHVEGCREAVISSIAAQSERSIAEVIVHNLMMNVCARSRFFEDQLMQARTRGIQQLVILGAGLDSTAYRCAKLTAGLQVFEVDYPATQTWKHEQLAANGIAIPDNLKFVPFDFERQTLAGALSTGGIRTDAMTLFSCLGVQPYLNDQTVMATLDVIARFASGSELVMDLVTAVETIQSDAMADGLRRAREGLARSGEPFKSVYDPDVFRSNLQQRGFNHIDVVSVRDWFDRHHERFQGRFSIYPGPVLFLVSARVG